MLDLKRIKKTDEYIEAEYYPEGSDEKGFVRINRDGKVVEKKETSYDELMSSYLSIARNKLIKLNSKDKRDIPDHMCVMWY